MQVIYRELPKNRSFGVELEVSRDIHKLRLADYLVQYESLSRTYRRVSATPGIKGWSESKCNDYWHVKYDSTCGHLGKYRDHGWEVASYVGTGGNDIRAIANGAQYLSKVGVKTTRNCGLHVHVNARDLSIDRMAILLARWLKIEPYLVAICLKRRDGNKYCRSLLQRYINTACFYSPEHLEDFYRSMRPTNFGSHNNSDKKYTLNILGYTIYQRYDYWNRPTVELRLPECRLQKSHVANWTRLFLNFVDACNAGKAPKSTAPVRTVTELLKLLGLHGDGEFLMLDRDLLETKKWFLQKLSRSYRLSQEASGHLDFISQI